MEFKKIVSIIRRDKLESVEKRLQEIQVPGISVTKCKGYGEHANFFAADWLAEHARIEIYCDSSNAEKITKAIMDAAHTGLEGDGIVAVIPVEQVYRIRTKTEAEGC